MAEVKQIEMESSRSMRPVAVAFFSAVVAVAALLTGTASFAVSPLDDASSIELAIR